MQTKRVAIVGTAPSYKETPWNDPSVSIWALNDAYSLGIPRADQWFDLHPISKMWFRPKDKKVLHVSDVPHGAYIRPQGHLEWLQKQAVTIPVWLQDTPPAEWGPNAKRFPFEDVKALLKARPDQDAYIASSPEMMVAHAMLQGAEEILIYGIHLSTEQEYREQRPSFEWLLGRAQERGITITLPESCPLLRHSHVYGYEPRPTPPDAEAVQKLQSAQSAYQELVSKLVTWPRFKSKAKELSELARLKAAMRDAKQQGRHALIHAGAR